MSNTEKNNIATISTEELAAKINAGERFEFWNVLTDEYYSRENIAGSRRLPLDRIGREISDAKLPKDTAIVVYCAGPECPQSGAAQQKLRTLGFSNVLSYEGGLEEWEAAGLPIVLDEAAPEANDSAAINAGMSCH